MTATPAVPSFHRAPAPLVGHLLHAQRDPLNFFLELGLGRDLASYQAGSERRYFVNSPELLREVWQDARYHRPPITRKVLASVTGPNLLTQEGTEHRRHRRLMQPAFHRERLTGYAALMATHAEQWAERHAGGGDVDLVREMKRVALDIVSASLFSAERREVVGEVTGALESLLPTLDRDILVHAALPRRVPVVFWGRDREAVRVIREGLAWIVSARRALRPETGDLLDMLLEARDEDGSALTDEEVASQALTLMTAGYETTANTLAWMWLLLAQHPEIMIRLQEELDDVLGGRPLTFADLPRLRYTEWVVKETQRLYPAAWLTGRMPTTDVVLGGVPLAAGTNLVTSAYVTHRDPRFFSEPERFWPERFAAEAQLPRFAYLPFGAGAHMCIGNVFALWEMKVILATLAGRFSFHLSPGFTPRLHLAITLGLRELPVRLQPRS